MDKACVDFEALFRINQAEAFFVTRAKTSQRHEVIEQNFNIDQDKWLRAEMTIMPAVTKSKKLYPGELRLVEFYDSQNDELIAFLTSNFNVSALEVANLYKNR